MNDPSDLSVGSPLDRAHEAELDAADPDALARAREIVTSHDLDWQTFDNRTELPDEEWPQAAHDLVRVIEAQLRQDATAQRRQGAEKMRESAANRCRSRGMAAAHANIFGRLHEAYRACETEIRALSLTSEGGE